MNREDAIYYLKSSGMSDEQIQAVEDGFLSVIEDIKSDIADLMDEIPTRGNCKEGWHNSGQRIGLEQACEIIDRHISGKAESEDKE